MSRSILVDLTPLEGRNRAVPAVLFAVLLGLLLWLPLTRIMDVGVGGARAVLGVLFGVGVLALTVGIRDFLVFPRRQTVELGHEELAVHTANRLGEDHWVCPVSELTSVDLLGELLVIRRASGTKYVHLHGQSTTNRLALRNLLRAVIASPGTAVDVPPPLAPLVSQGSGA